MTDEIFKAQREKYGENYIGNVIRIIDDRTVIINVGNSTLSVGDTVQIYEPVEPLFDIDGTKLCDFEFIKEELRVIRVENKYSICQKNESIAKTITYALSPLLVSEQGKHVPLNVNTGDIQELKVGNPTVGIGDPVKLA